MLIMRRINKNGFTLIELLTVVVILGIIITIAVTGYNVYISRTNKIIMKIYLIFLGLLLLIIILII